MTTDIIRAALTSKPFRPFTIHTRSGREYQIGDPDLAQVSDTTLTLMAAGPNNTTSRVADIDLNHVISLTLDASTETP